MRGENVSEREQKGNGEMGMGKTEVKYIYQNKKIRNNFNAT